ncbi:unnamed protein product [Staurois parvus]|uniref:Uncharacterized protein n=1 Tax=Staurois parvus TaxID=386267 RepID=A0ABN9F6N3_9NEOB|nr:unnamed protein product [Staurois parvus]
MDEALPALDAALASLKSLNKNDVTEVRALQSPPVGSVKLVIESRLYNERNQTEESGRESPE